MNTLILIYLATVIFTLFSFNFFKDETSTINDTDSGFSELIISLIPIVNILISISYIKNSVYGIRCYCGKTHFNNSNLCDDCEFNHHRELYEFYRKRFKENK